MSELRSKLLRLEEVIKEMEELDTKLQVTKDKIRGMHYEFRSKAVFKKGYISLLGEAMRYNLKSESLRVERLQLFKELFKEINDLEEK